jgi:GATA-binding protein
MSYAPHAHSTFLADLDARIELQAGLHVSETNSVLSNTRLALYYDESNSSSSSAGHSLTSASTTTDGNLDFSPADTAVRKGVLRSSVFPAFSNSSGGVEESPEDMQQKDPLQFEVWKLYSKAKSQLPNSERMSNLTWRMMSMNLRKLELERERQKGLVS